MKAFRLACLLTILGVLLGGCGLISGLPSQANPTCSWTSQPPSDAATVCRTVYRTLTALTTAERRGDDATIRRLVTNPVVAERIIAFGRQKRSGTLRFLRPTPSVTLGASVNGTLGVGLQVVGQSRAGTFRAPQTIYVRLRGGTAYVVDDQPEQEW